MQNTNTENGTKPLWGIRFFFSLTVGLIVALGLLVPRVQAATVQVGVAPRGYDYSRALAETVVDSINRRGRGEVTADLVTVEGPGNAEQLTDQLRQGGIHIAILDSRDLGLINSGLAGFDAPFLFPNGTAVVEFMNFSGGERIAELLRQNHMQLISWYSGPPISLLSEVDYEREINPQRLRIGVESGRSSGARLFTSAGAEVVSLRPEEALQAFSDGSINTIEVDSYGLATVPLYEDVEYTYIITNHLYPFYVLCLSDTIKRSMAPEDIELVTSLLHQAAGDAHSVRLPSLPDMRISHLPNLEDIASAMTTNMADPNLRQALLVASDPAQFSEEALPR